MEGTETMELVVVEMTEKMVVAMAMTETAAAAMIMMAIEMTVTVMVGIIEMACWRGCWPISGISETRIIWNITVSVLSR
jgi:hypothetical protein